MYKRLIRPLLFLLSPERAHHVAVALLSAIWQLPGIAAVWQRFHGDAPSLERLFFGLRFPNPVGLAAGFDKNGQWIDPLGSLGFGFIEIGTITPRAQAGNPKPRLFRLPHERALVNRMGFNNEGAETIAARLQQRKGDRLIVGGNIGKNRDTPNEQAAADYVACFEALYRYVDYFVINVSSPNTPGLRTLQSRDMLWPLLARVQAINREKTQPKPILLKVSPELGPAELDDIAEAVTRLGIDGVVASNTLATDAPAVSPAAKKAGPGGISGGPLAEAATAVIRGLRQRLGPHVPIIGVGGIMSPQDALDKLNAGANLVQLYTGFIYEGPGLIRRIKAAIAAQDAP